MSEIIPGGNIYMSNIFISWSGDKAGIYAEFLANILNTVLESESYAFLSKKIESGKIWSTKITSALGESTVGIFILTRYSMKQPWVNFEAGAIFKGDTLAPSLIPIYVDIEFEDLKDHPLGLFQSRYKFSCEDITKLIIDLESRYEWCEFHTGVWENTVKSLFDEFMKTNEKMNNNSIEDYLYNNKIAMSDNTCVVAEIPAEKFWGLRLKLIESLQGGELILEGSSLEDAFGGSELVSIVKCLKSKIQNKEINHLKILISDPVIFSEIENFDKSTNSPLNRVSLTMDTLLHQFFPLCEEVKCDIDIYFMPLLEIDHAVITDKYMAFRSTKLWTQNGMYKGSFFLYRKTEIDCSEYGAQMKYLETVMENSTRIDLEIDSYESPDDGETMRRHKSWRRAVKDAGYTVVHMYKLYYSQLVNYVADDWRNEPGITGSFKPSKSIRNYDELFDPQNLLNDDTQKVLLPYIKETKKVFELAIKKYDSSTTNIGMKRVEKSGVMVFPSLDLGFPNNVQRLAGGFATGMLVMWKCGTHIVPIDATVNVCSSSVFEIEDFNTDLCDEEFISYIEGIMHEANQDEGYSFSFKNGNHFLMIAQDISSKKLYLVLHSSATEFKNSYLGLYPDENNWYSNSIRTYPSPLTSERYIRYIKDNEAKYFIENAHKLEKYNVQIHRWFAERIGWQIDENCHTFHHYYMHTNDSIAIGTYVETPGTIVPIFSNVGKDIYMFKIGKDNWKVHLGGRNVCLVPHGWGQVIDGVKSVSVDNDEHVLIVNDRKYSINSKARIKNVGNKHVRNFKDGEEFLNKGGKMIKGDIVQTLRPIYLYCSEKRGKVNERM
jgi:hypothetical protein